MVETVNKKTPRCLTCDYPLIGLNESRCPECGQTFDLSDATTFYSGAKPVGAVGRFFWKPPGKYFHCACGITVFITLFANSVPEGYFLLMILCIYLWGALAVIWWIRGIGYSFFTTRRHGTRAATRYMKWRSWAVGPASLALAFVLNLTQLPLWATYWLSKSSMDRLATQVITTSSPVSGPMRVGLIQAVECEPILGGMQFCVDGSGFLDRGGFAYFKTPPNPNTQLPNQYVHWHGNWYTWSEDF